MEQFTQNYAALNDAQKQAVDTIEGPVMVVAGPGTGKTQLLSMRVANILRSSDVNPQNILCLTFTESGAAAMRERLVQLVGQPAYCVAIHTFHSFGSEVINKYGDYFYRGAHFRAADELSSYEVLRAIFEKLPHKNPLSSQMNGEFTSLRDAQKAISDVKKSGLTPDEIQQILDHNESFIVYAQPLLNELFQARLSKKSFPAVEQTVIELEKYQDGPLPVIGYEPLSTVASHSLQTALDEAVHADNTKALGAWRSKWLEKDAESLYVFKDIKRNEKLRALSGIYYQYLVAMQERALYDFDDMILRVVHGMEVFAELRYNLQEQYQYILVDEFQDTNGAQMRLLWNLTNNEVSAGRPNILVVGDDDQAIYRFQGADISNILSFRELYKDPAIITLKDNYRSTSNVLDTARTLIVQAEERLETQLDGIDKQLTAHRTNPDSTVQLHGFQRPSDEYNWIVSDIKRRITAGEDPNDMAIIARNHAELKMLMPYMHDADIPVSYERQDNVLLSPPVVLLHQVARVLHLLSQQHFSTVDSLLPELLSHPAWSIKTIDIWQLSLKAFKDRRFWLEIMLETPGRLKDIAEWLIVSAHVAQHEPLEPMLDRILGTDEFQVAHESHDSDEPFSSGPHEEFTSPIRAYYFPSGGLQTAATDYLQYLGALTTIRRSLREYRPDEVLQLSDFVEYIDLHNRTRIGIPSNVTFQSQTESVHVMTAHKSKGLEFDTVYLLSMNEDIWGSKSRGKSSSLSFPANLPLAAVGDSDDERIRLLYVAMTRAKSHLHITTHAVTAKGKQSLPVSYGASLSLPKTEHPEVDEIAALTATAEAQWHEQIIKLPQVDIQQLLAPTLKQYKLSATHLNNFIDVTAGGPQSFLLQNLLRFPQAMSPSAAFGSAIHGALQRAHAHLSATGKRRPVEDVLHDFDQLLSTHQLSRSDHDKMQQRGSDVLHGYLSQRYESFTDTQIVERNFSSQHVTVDGVTLTGAIDLIDKNDDTKTIIVTDYKTGKSLKDWQGGDAFSKIKAHKYKQQLMLYKLLVEHSRDFGGSYTVERGILEFVEPNIRGSITLLELSYSSEELEEFKLLLKAVWSCIQSLDFPDISGYEQSYAGILAFEADLKSSKST